MFSFSYLLVSGFFSECRFVVFLWWWLIAVRCRCLFLWNNRLCSRFVRFLFAGRYITFLILIVFCLILCFRVSGFFRAVLEIWVLFLVLCIGLCFRFIFIFRVFRLCLVIFRVCCFFRFRARFCRVFFFRSWVWC